jgi:hypothetical protein
MRAPGSRDIEVATIAWRRGESSTAERAPPLVAARAARRSALARRLLCQPT